MNNAATTERVYDRATYRFASSTDAWTFMRACDRSGIVAGFPGLKDHTVSVAIFTSVDRETTDVLANGAEVVDYKFKAGRV